MAGADQLGMRRLAHLVLLETDALVPLDEGCPPADPLLAIAQHRRDARDLEAALLARVNLAVDLLERLEEERPDEVGLEPAGVGALHLLADPGHVGQVHRVGGERLLLEQGQQMVVVHGGVDDAVEPGAHLWVIAVADRLDEQLAQRLLVE